MKQPTPAERATRVYTLAQAHKVVQWERLIVTIHKAQEAANYAGRQFGADEMRFFGASLIGLPREMRHGNRVYWVERQTMEHSDHSESVSYALKVWDSSDAKNVETIERSEPLFDPTPAEDQALALDFARRAAFQVGATL